MKLLTLLGAGALAAGTMVAAAPPAAAQAYGYGRDHHGYGARVYRPHRVYRSYGYRGPHGYYRPAYRGYAHRGTVCRVHRGYYGSVRRCYR